jgi:hypothetical protein
VFWSDPNTPRPDCFVTATGPGDGGRAAVSAVDPAQVEAFTTWVRDLRVVQSPDVPDLQGALASLLRLRP